MKFSDDDIKKAIEHVADIHGFDIPDDETAGLVESVTIATIRALLACDRPSVEPDGWMTEDGRIATNATKQVMPKASQMNFNIPLYTHPALDRSSCAMHDATLKAAIQKCYDLRKPHDGTVATNAHNGALFHAAEMIRALDHPTGAAGPVCHLHPPGWEPKP
jgi:hypothetical protein